MSWIEEMKCEECGAQSMSGFVQYASYFVRCSLCGSKGVATTWLAYACQIEGNVSAYTVDANFRTIELLAVGDVTQIKDAVTNAAKIGALVQLRRI